MRGERSGIEKEPRRKSRLLETRASYDESSFKVTSFQYDDEGRVISKKSRLVTDDEVRKYDSEQVKTYKEDRAYTYDSDGRLIREDWVVEKYRISSYRPPWTSIMGVSRETIYDDNGNPVLVSSVPLRGERNRDGKEDFDGRSESIGEVSNEYNDQGQLVRVLSEWPDRGTEKRMEYDDEGRLSVMLLTLDTSLPENVTRYRYSYDEQGRLVSELRGHAKSDKDYGEMKYTYSEDGLTKTQENVCMGEVIWRYEKTHDKHGNEVGQKWIDVDWEGSETVGKETLVENIYE